MKNLAATLQPLYYTAALSCIQYSALYIMVKTALHAFFMNSILLVIRAVTIYQHNACIFLLYIHICVYVYVYTNIHTYTINRHTYIHFYMYMYMYICTYMYTYICMFFTSLESSFN